MTWNYRDNQQEAQLVPFSPGLFTKDPMRIYKGKVYRLA